MTSSSFARMWIAGLAAALVTLPAAADAQRARAAMGRMPGLAGLEVEVTESAEPGVYVAGLPTDAVKLLVFQTDPGLDKPWHAMLLLKEPKRFSFRAVHETLAERVVGDVSPSHVAIIVSTKDDSAAVARFPKALGKVLPGFADAKGEIALKEGANVYTHLKVGTKGLLGRVSRTLDMDRNAPILVGGQVGPGTVAMLLRDAGVRKTAAPQDTKASKIALTVIFPEVTPMPYAVVDNKDLLHMVYRSTRLSIAHTAKDGADGRAHGFDISGAQDVRLWVLGERVDVKTRLSFAAGDDDEFAMTAEGRASLNWKDPLLLPGATIRAITLSMDAGEAATKGAAFDVGAVVALPDHGELAGTFGATVTGDKITDLRMRLAGVDEGDGINLSKLPGLALLPGIESFTMKEMTAGLDPTNKDVYLQGAVSWPAKGVTAEGAIVRKHVSATQKAVILFLQADGLNLRTLVKALPEKAESLTLDRGMIAVSSRDFNDLKASELPPVVQDMMAKVTGDLEREIPVFAGVTLFMRLDPAALKGEIKDAMVKFGIEQPVVLAGSIGGIFEGQPAIALYADLPAVAVQAAVKRQPFKLNPRAGVTLFLVAQTNSAGVEFQLGLDGTVGVEVGGDELEFGGRCFVTLSAISQGVRISGRMMGIWDEPFQLQDIAFGDLVIGGGVDADSSIEVAMGGTFKFDRFEYDMAGLVSIIAGSGGFVPKKLGLSFSGSEMSQLTAVQIMGAFVRGAAGGPLANALPDGQARSMVKRAASQDLVSRIESVVPLPYMSYRDFAFYLVTPGASFPDLPALGGMGVGVKGTLRFMNRDLNRAETFLTLREGLTVYANPGDFDLGPGLKMTGTVLDVRVPMPGVGNTEQGRFLLAGDMGYGCSVVEGGIEVLFNRDEARFGVTASLAGYETEFEGQVSLRDFPDFSAEGQFAKDLAQDVAEMISTVVKQRVEAAKREVEQRIAAVKAEVDAAQALVDETIEQGKAELRDRVEAKITLIRKYAKDQESDNKDRPVLRNLWAAVHDAAGDIKLDRDGNIDGISKIKRKLDEVADAAKDLRGKAASELKSAVNRARTRVDDAVDAARDMAGDLQKLPAVVAARKALEDARSAVKTARQDITAATIDPIADRIQSARDTLVIDEVGFDSGLDALCKGRLPMLNVKGSFAGTPFDLQECLQLATKKDLLQRNRENLDRLMTTLAGPPGGKKR